MFDFSLSFHLPKDFVESYKSKPSPFGFNGLGELVYYRTYSRIKENGENEDWVDTVERVVNVCYSIQKQHILKNKLVWSENKAIKSAKEMFDHMFNLRFTPPGRGLWAMTPELISKVGSAALNNPLHIDTKVMTTNGLVALKDMKGDNDYLLVNANESYLNLTKGVYSYENHPKVVVGTVSYLEYHPCIKITFVDNMGAETSVIASMNHRWYIKAIHYTEVKRAMNRVSTEFLRIGNQIPRTVGDIDDFVTVKALEYVGIQPVKCLTVPEHEQFIIEGGIVTSNCGFTSTVNMDKSIEDATKPFEFLMDMSMLGVGIGFDVKGKDSLVVNTPVSDQLTVYTIPDTREGWVESVKLLLQSYFGKHFGLDTVPYTFDYSLIRAKGEPIRTFGGVASGPEPLKILHERIRLVLDKLDGKLMTVTAITDIMNMIGCCVVAGNVRRCLPKGTLVHTYTGLKPIETVEKGDLVYTTKGVFPVSEMVYQGKQEVIELHTQLGAFKCTEKHKMARLISPNEYEWVMAKDLKQGDRLVFPANVVEGIDTVLPSWYYDKSKYSTTCVDITIPDLDEEMSWFFGMLHGDGNVYPNFENNGFNAYVSIACHESHIDIIEKVQKCFSRFGVKTSIIKGDGKYVRVNAQSKQLAWYLSQFKTANSNIEVPEFIMMGKANIRAAYLAGLFDADGSSQNKPTVLVTSVYKEFIRTVQALYASLAIPSRLRSARDNDKRLAKGWQKLYNLYLVGQLVKQRCEDLVFSKSIKYQNNNKTNRSQNDYGFPSEWIKESDVKKSNWCHNCEQMTIGRYVENGEELKYIPIELLFIERNQEEVETYDISVPGANEFVAQEGILTHNTAEIVFGDYNDDEYLKLKDYYWNQDGSVGGSAADRSEWGWASNNSIFAELGMNYEKVAYQTGKNGEPGYAWLQNMRHYGRMIDGYQENIDGKAAGGNPCVTGDTLVMLASGAQVRIDSLIGKEIQIWNGYEVSTVKPRITGLNEVVHRVHLEDQNGEMYNVKCTGYHKWITSNKGRITTDELRDTDTIEPYNTASGKPLALRVKYIERNYDIADKVYCMYEPLNNSVVFNGVMTGNCLEQTLEHMEICCLVETYPTRCKDDNEFYSALKYAYLYAKTVTLIPTHEPETNNVMFRNRRIGTSLTDLAGYMQDHGIEKLRQICDNGYNLIQYYDEVYSNWLCIPRSIKTTSIKPSGTVSLLAGVRPGIHYPEANYYIRRVRVASTSPLVECYREAGYHVEQDVMDKFSMVIEFPIYITGRTVNDVSIWEQASFAAFIQEWWADNQVSVTITVKPEEIDQIEHVLNYYQYRLKGVSFLPKVEYGAYPQMPYEEITKEKFDNMMSVIKPVDIKLSSAVVTSTGEKYCDGDKCIMN